MIKLLYNILLNFTTLYIKNIYFSMPTAKIGQSYQAYAQNRQPQTSRQL